MALQFIIGGSGSGKSWLLHQKIIQESLENPGKRYLILVPEQFTMQTQKDLVMRHPSHGIMNIDVLSFQRLAYHVFDEVGGNRKVLEETGKSLVIRRLAQQNREQLAILGSKLERMGYVGEMKSVLSELAQYRVSPEMLLETLEDTKDNRLLSGKLHDILILQKAFQKYKEDTYITSEELLEELSRVIQDSKKTAGSIIALDGFTGFTPVQYLLLEKLLCQAEDVLVTVTMDAQEYPFNAMREEELFAMSKRTIWELRRIADSHGITEKEPILLGREELLRCRRGGNPSAMAFLEKHLLRYDGEHFQGEQDAIRLFQAGDPEEEVRLTAYHIGRLIRTEGYRFRDIAVITGDMDGYGSLLERQFADSGIACFIDRKRDILSNPCVEFLRSALEMMADNFSYPSVFRYLRCGLTGIPDEAVDRLDNYCTALGIRGYKRYTEEWTGTYRGQNPEELCILNETREQFLAQVQNFKEECTQAGRTVRERTEGLFRWCERLQIQQKLADREEIFKERGELELAREYAQVYRIVIELFDKLVELMGDEVLPLKEYAKILDAGFEEARVGIIPPGTDQVMVGDIERTRLKDIRALFFLGVNDGIIPAVGGNCSILSEYDRENLKKLHLPLAPSRKENIYIQQFYLYLNLSRPSERLYITFSRRNLKGEVLRPSYLIGMLEDLYPGLAPESTRTSPASKRQEFLWLAQQLAEGVPDLPAAEGMAAYHAARPEGREKLEKLFLAADDRKQKTALNRAAAHAVYGDVLVGSATRLEQYAACAYAHFLTYGLRLKERQEYAFRAMDLGNVLHRALELYTGELKKSRYSWFDIPEEVQESLIDHCVSRVAEEYGNTVLRSSFRNAGMIDRMKQMGRRTVWAVTEQIRHGKFEPRGFEISFSSADHLDTVNFALKDGTRMKLTGRIDRTDIFEDDGHVYVKVVDYKTGKKSFDVGDVYDGLSLQLVVYMNAALEMEERTHSKKKVVPAALLYYQIKDPIIEAEEPMTDEQLSQERLRALCTKGLVNSDPEIIRLLDGRIGSSSAVIPAGLTKAGTPSGRSSTAETGQMEALFYHVQEKIRDLGGQIMDGVIEARPAKKGTRTACDFCLYRGICGFDPRLKGQEYRRFPAVSAQKVWERLESEREAERKDIPGKDAGTKKEGEEWR